MARKPRRPSYKQVNKRIAESHGCIMTGKTEGLDPAHCPTRQSSGAGWGLLEFVPLIRYWHRRYDDPADKAAKLLVEANARYYYDKMLRAHPECYLGPPERIREVEAWTQ